MALDTEVLKSAQDKKFTEFEKAVKQELSNKLSNHKVTKQYVSDFDKIQQMKDSFEKIRTDVEPEKVEPEKVEPEKVEPEKVE